jgi:4-carboxymuconolactone decarboxylase
MSLVMSPTATDRPEPAFTGKFAQLTQDLLFGDIWQRPELSPRERSLVTVAALVALYRLEQLPFHLQRARDNGVSTAQLSEVITHLAFYSGWPTAASALTLLQQATSEQQPEPQADAEQE